MFQCGILDDARRASAATALAPHAVTRHRPGTGPLFDRYIYLVVDESALAESQTLAPPLHHESSSTKPSPEPADGKQPADDDDADPPSLHLTDSGEDQSRAAPLSDDPMTKMMDREGTPEEAPISDLAEAPTSTVTATEAPYPNPDGAFFVGGRGSCFRLRPWPRRRGVGSARLEGAAALDALDALDALGCA